METKNFKNIAAIDADYVVSTTFYAACLPFDFTDYTIVGKLYDFFGADTGIIIGITVSGGTVTATVPANTVEYSPAIYTLKVTGTDGVNVTELIRVLISYQK